MSTAPEKPSNIEGRRLSRGLSAIEEQLAALWRVEEGQSPRVRACIYNLVAVGRGEPPRETIETIDALGATHPARNVVLAVEDRGAPNGFAWDVNAVCRREPSGDVVCCERVDLKIGPEPADRVASLLAALLLPDLATIVWVVSEPPPTLPLEVFYPVADRWVIDTRLLPSEQAAHLAGTTPGYLADLGWIASSAWRELLSRAFDAPWLLPLLSDIDEIELSFSPPERGRPIEVPVEARLLAGWLASRLGLRWQDGDLVAGTRRVRIRFDVAASAPAANAPSPARLERVLLRGPLGPGRATVAVERDAVGDVFHWWATGPLGPGLPIRRTQHFPQLDAVSLLARALDASESDRVLREALLSAAAFRPLLASRCG